MFRALRIREATSRLASGPTTAWRSPISRRSPPVAPARPPSTRPTQVLRWHMDKVVLPEIGATELPPSKFDFTGTPESFVDDAAERKVKEQMDADMDINPEELTEEDKEIYMAFKELEAWFNTLSEMKQDQFMILWYRPHVRYAIDTILRDPQQYPRFIHNKDVVKFLELTGMKPWDDAPYTPGIASDVIPQGTDFDRSVVFPDRYIRLRNIDEWGTFLDPVLIPTKYSQRIVECLGYCVPGTKGLSRMWRMKPGETCVCDECLQFFHCFNENVYKPGYEEKDDYMEVLPEKEPMEQAEEWVEGRRKQEREQLEHMVAVREKADKARTQIRGLLKELGKGLFTGDTSNDAKYLQQIEELEKETLDAQRLGVTKFTIWRAEKRARSRAASDNDKLNRLAAEIQEKKAEEEARVREEKMAE